MNPAKTPTAPDAQTLADWQRTSLRLRILESSAWRGDLVEYMKQHVGTVSLVSWGRPSIALNLLKSVVYKVANVTRKGVATSNSDISPEAAEYVEGLGLFARARRHERHLVGLRESLYRVNWDAVKQRASAEVVAPNEVYMTADPCNPSQLIAIEHATERKDPRNPKKVAWFWESWDISDPSNPRYRMFTDYPQHKDVSAAFEIDPAAYPWRDAATSTPATDDAPAVAGVPFLPWVLVHAEDTGELTDSDGWHEIVDGTLMIGMLVTFWSHVVRNASWSQAFGMDVRIRGTRTKGEGAEAQRSVATDPKSILQFDSDGSNPQIGTIDKPSDPEYVIRAILTYADWVLSQLGLNADAAQATASASGVSITIRREGVVLLQQAYVEAMRLGDVALLTTAALTVNALSLPTTPAIPTEGWSVTYPAEPQTRDELVEKLDGKLKLIDAGLLSRVDLMQEQNPGMSKDKAIEELARIEAENKLGTTEPGKWIGAITAALSVAQSVSLGDITPAVGTAIVEIMLGIEPTQAARLVGAAGATLTPEPPTPAEDTDA